MLLPLHSIANNPSPVEPPTTQADEWGIALWVFSVIGVLVFGFISLAATVIAAEKTSGPRFVAVLVFCVYALILTAVLNQIPSTFAIKAITIFLGLLMLGILVKFRTPSWFPYVVVIIIHVLILFQVLFIDRQVAPALSQIFGLSS